MSPAVRSWLIRRPPTTDELATRSPIALTDRDQQVLAAVYRFGLLTTDLVELAFFPDAGRTSHCSRAYQRLRDLWLWGFLERVELPSPRSLGGRRPFVYTLGRQGVPLVEARNTSSSMPIQQRRVDRLDFAPIDHDLQAAALWANLVAETRRRGLRPPRWTGERQLRAMRMRVREPHSGRWLPFLPDGYAEVVYPSGAVQRALVEVDAGTLTLRRFAWKVRAFELAVQAEPIRRRFRWDDDDDEPEVWVVTTSERRLDSLRSTAARIVGADRHESYWLATFRALVPDRFAAWDWQDLTAETAPGVLYGDVAGTAQ